MENWYIFMGAVTRFFLSFQFMLISQTHPPVLRKDIMSDFQDIANELFIMNNITVERLFALGTDAFEINDDGFAQAKVDVVPENVKDDCMDAAEGCPVSAIVVED